MVYIIYQTAFIGDIILATSMAASIKRIKPDSKVIFITTLAGKGILANNKNIDYIITYDKRKTEKGIRGVFKVVSKIKSSAGGESVFISPHRFLRASIIGLLSGSKNRIGFKNSAASFLYSITVPYKQGMHEIERNQGLLKADACLQIAENDPPPDPELFPSYDDYAAAKQAIGSAFPDKRQLVSIAPGSIWPTKRWPKEYYLRLITLLKEKGLGVVLIGGPEDVLVSKGLESENVLNLTGKFTILESAAAISLTCAVITNDSAPLHIASAMKIPALAIFGATTPNQGFGPLAPKSIIIENRSLDCRPCGRHGGKKCRQGHFKCMRDLSPELVFNELINILA